MPRWLCPSGVRKEPASGGISQTLSSPFWGELNDLAETKAPTFCGLNDHYLATPRIGSANYFGSDYVRFFEDFKDLKGNELVATEPLHRGVLISIHTGDPFRFAARQETIEALLGGSRVFGVVDESKIRVGSVPEFHDVREHVSKYVRDIRGIEISGSF